MNKVIFMGRLTKDPEIRYSQGAEPMAIANFSLAIDRRFKRDGEPDADFFDCTAFGKQGEFVEKYLKKGTKIVIEGRLQNNNYTNKEGQKVYATRVICDSIEFAESKKDNGQQQYQAPPMQPQMQPQMMQTPPQMAQMQPQMVQPQAQPQMMQAPPQMAQMQPQMVQPQAQPQMAQFMNMPQGVMDELPFN